MAQHYFFYLPNYTFAIQYAILSVSESRFSENPRLAAYQVFMNSEATSKVWIIKLMGTEWNDLGRKKDITQTQMLETYVGGDGP